MPTTMPWLPYGQPTGITGAPSSGYSPSAGGIPIVPNPIFTTEQALLGDIGQMPQLQQLLGGLNQFQQQQLLGQYAAAIPGYQGLQQASSANIASDLAGKVSPDVLAELQQGAAERGIATGAPGSPNANAAYLRALGLTSLGLQQQGQGELTAAMGRAPVAQPITPTQFMTTPQDVFSAQQLANLYASAPNPAALQAANQAAFAAGQAAGRGGPRGGTGGTAIPPPDTSGGYAPGPAWRYGGGGIAPSITDQLSTDAYTSPGQYFSPTDQALQDYWASVLGYPYEPAPGQDVTTAPPPFEEDLGALYGDYTGP